MLDVRASPYDLSNASELLAGTESVFGDLSPVRIETLDGRQEYQRIQGEIAADAVPLRLRLLEAYESALEPLGATTGREGDGGGSSGARRSRRLRPTPALPPPADGWEGLCCASRCALAAPSETHAGGGGGGGAGLDGWVKEWHHVLDEWWLTLAPLTQTRLTDCLPGISLTPVGHMSHSRLFLMISLESPRYTTPILFFLSPHMAHLPCVLQHGFPITVVSISRFFSFQSDKTSSR